MLDGCKQSKGVPISIFNMEDNFYVLKKLRKE